MLRIVAMDVDYMLPISGCYRLLSNTLEKPHLSVWSVIVQIENFGLGIGREKTQLH